MSDMSHCVDFSSYSIESERSQDVRVYSFDSNPLASKHSLCNKAPGTPTENFIFKYIPVHLQIPVPVHLQIPVHHQCQVFLVTVALLVDAVLFPGVLSAAAKGPPLSATAGTAAAEDPPLSAAAGTAAVLKLLLSLPLLGQLLLKPLLSLPLLGQLLLKFLLSLLLLGQLLLKLLPLLE